MTWSIVVLSVLLGIGPRAFAQAPSDVPRFQPPRPPSLDQEFEDAEEEEVIDQPGRMPAPPATGVPSATTPVQPPTDFRPTNSAVDPGKIHFKVVEGAFYEKGKPRGRSPKNGSTARR